MVEIKGGVEFKVFSPASLKILPLLKEIAKHTPVTITSGTDGEHSGPSDPHHRGEAYDIRTKGLGDFQKASLLQAIQTLGPRFYAFLEAPGTDNEHIHVQVKKNTIYTILDYFSE